jgi:hypothetical protein
MTLRSFEVCLADHVAPVEERLAVVMRPDGVRIRFKRRTASSKVEPREASFATNQAAMSPD